MATTKTLIAEDVAGVVEAGDHTFVVDDITVGKTLKIDGIKPGDVLVLNRQNYAGDGYEPVTDEVNGQRRVVQLNEMRRTAPIAEVGTYSLDGVVAGPCVIWTEEMA